MNWYNKTFKLADFFSQYGYWIDPFGKLIPVGFQAHDLEAMKIIKEIKPNIWNENRYNQYFNYRLELLKLGYIRYVCGKDSYAEFIKINNAQKRTIINLLKESNADTISITNHDTAQYQEFRNNQFKYVQNI